MAHTPGPWTVFSEAETIEVWSGDGKRSACPVIHWQGFDHDRPADEHEANANLIAAAPDLLAALKAFTDAETHMSFGRVMPVVTHSDILRARAAIAKAEGQR